jgi:hypothetical protein
MTEKPKSHQIIFDQITTDDLAFSAYLKVNGHRLIKSDQNGPKAHFTFEIDRPVEELKVEFINSQFIQFYNELRNLKKMVSSK